jgi:hypothetical protein
VPPPASPDYAALVSCAEQQWDCAVDRRNRRPRATLCDAGATVQHVETLGTEHVTEEYVRASEALDFLADPFAGKPAVTTGATIPAAPVEPAQVRQQSDPRDQLTFGLE